VAGADAPAAGADGDGFKPHYDPAIAVPFRAITPELAQAGQAALWQPTTACAAPRCCCAVPQSDLLSAATAQAMTERGPRARLAVLPAWATRPRWCSPTRWRWCRGSCCAMKTDPGAGAPRAAAPIVALTGSGVDGAGRQR
jgi:hypothetical protein